MPASQKNKPQTPPPKTIAALGRDAAARKAARTEDKIAHAQRAIEADIEKHGGVYPYAGGRLSAKEVLRRAGLNETLLQKSRHTSLKVRVNSWVTDIKEKQLKGKDVVRKAVTERADRSDDELFRIRQQWAEAELEFVEQENEIARLQKNCAELEEEVRVLRDKASREIASDIEPDALADLLREFLRAQHAGPDHPSSKPL
ncbi:hypothetical protein [Oricola sp.]|uniref:hypothetical protein n=1 Tax=Oricola sp. TaxID=1979950 RepID=UPI0025EEB74C|nr:hypothetical protein [Oricola sp.]MCI5076392.1 hypothetical protein [Oricola sp.]